MNIRALPAVNGELHDALARLVARGHYTAARRLWADWQSGLTRIGANP